MVDNPGVRKRYRGKGNPNPSPKDRFQPGKSGNPSGITKAQAAEIQKARNILYKTAVAAADRHRKTVLKGSGSAPVNSAADSVLDRTIGKPPQEVNAQVVVQLERRMERMTTAIAAALEAFPEAKAAVFAALQENLGSGVDEG